MRGQKAPLLDRIDDKYVVDPNSGCWLWTGSLDEEGYGRMNRGAMEEDAWWPPLPLAHRVMWIKERGEFPDGNLEPDHLCRTRCCINPNHLEWVTHEVNIARGLWQPNLNKAKTACDRGHPFVEGSFKVYGDSRKCMICNKMTCLDRYYRSKGRADESPLANENFQRKIENAPNRVDPSLFQLDFE